MQNTDEIYDKIPLKTEGITEEFPSNFHCKCQCHLMDFYENCQCDCEGILEKSEEIDENDECESIDIISIIKFCKKSKQIVFPAQVFH